MTENITHSPNPQADGVALTPTDSPAVIVRARKRNRRAVVTAFAAVAMVGVLAVSLNAAQPNSAAQPDIKTASASESRSDRLTTQLAAANLVPDRWRPAASPSPFSCALEEHEAASPDEPVPTEVLLGNGADTCRATTSYEDEEGRFELDIIISNLGMPVRFFMGSNSFDVELRNGTRAQGSVDGVGVQPASGGREELTAQQVNGIGLMLSVSWTNKRKTSPLTADELLKFATIEYVF